MPGRRFLCSFALMLVAATHGDRNSVAAPRSISAAPIPLLAQAGAVSGPRQTSPVMGGRGRTTPGDALRVKRLTIVDPSGFERPMNAAYLFVPVGLEPQGSVVWNVQMGACPSGPVINWAAQSPDGLWAVEIRPPVSWVRAVAGPAAGGDCPVLPIHSVRALLDAWVGQARPQATVLDFRFRNDIVAALRAAGLEGSSQMGALAMRTRFESGEMLIGYDIGGQPVRETILTTLKLMDMSTQMVGGEVFQTGSGDSTPIMVMRAPAGRLSFGHAELIFGSFRQDPGWAGRVAKVRQNIAADNLRTARNISEINRRSAEDINRILAKGRSDSNAAFDRNVRETGEMIRETETWNDPVDQLARELPQSSHAWRLDDGSFVVTDDPNWLPGEHGLQGQRLRRVQ
ncbi:MAG: hypothetical protein R3E87_16400 [Burkholderiaceae bacterium]